MASVSQARRGMQRAAKAPPGPTSEKKPEAARKPAYLQAKLRVSVPGDPQEQQADRVAAEVSRLVSAPDKEEQSLAPKLVREARQSEQATVVGEEAEGRIKALRGQGMPLPEGVRRDLEPQLGQDLGGARVHAGAEASALCAEVNARAFTVGRDVFFSPGEYAPEAESGRSLLAHELAHVVQQGGVGQSPHLARDDLDAGVAESSLPPLPRAIAFDEALPLMEEALGFVDPVAGVGDYRRVEEILQRFNTEEVFQLLTTLDLRLLLEGIREQLVDPRLSCAADIVFYAARGWRNAPSDVMRGRVAALERSEQDRIIAHIDSDESLAGAIEFFPVSVLAARQVQHLEAVRQERNRQRQEEAARSRQAPPPEMTLGEVIAEDVQQRSTPLSTVEDRQRQEANALRPRFDGIISRVRVSVVGTELEGVIRGKTFSYEPERAIREGFYGAQLGNSLLVGVGWVRDADRAPSSVWPNIAHELGGHLEYGQTFSGTIVQGVLAELPEDARQRLFGDAEARRRLFNSFEYAETEIFAELREMRYGLSADDPRTDIPDKLNELRSWFEPLVLHAIVRQLWRRILAASGILEPQKQFFVVSRDECF